MKFTKILTFFIAVTVLFLGANEASAIYFTTTHAWPGTASYPSYGTWKLEVTTNKNTYLPGENIILNYKITGTSLNAYLGYDTLFEARVTPSSQVFSSRGRVNNTGVIGPLGDAVVQVTGPYGSIVTGTVILSAPSVEGTYSIEIGTYIFVGYQYISWGNFLPNITVSTAPQPNRPPRMPRVVCSPEVIVNTPFDCAATATDPDGDTIRYIYDWTNTNSFGGYAPSSGYTLSGATESLTHTYNTVGFKSMQVRAEDSKGATSFWTPHSINVLSRTNSCTLPWGVVIPNFAWVYAYQAPSVDAPASCNLEFRMCINGVLDGSFTNQNCVVNVAAPCVLPWGGSIPSGNSTTAYQSATVMSPLSCTSQSRLCTNGTLSGSYTKQNCSVIPAVCTLPWGGSIASGNSATAYQTPSVISPAACTSQSRLCTNGTLAGTYANQSCVVNPSSGCGDGICSAPETPISCAKDCKVKYRQF